MRRCLLMVITGLGLAALIGLSSCGSKTKSATGALSNVAAELKSADAGLRAKADLAAASFKTNDYVGTWVALKDIQNAPGLTPPQLKAVQDAVDAVLGKMFDEAAKGDPHALEARNQLRQMQGRPGTR